LAVSALLGVPTCVVLPAAFVAGVVPVVSLWVFNARNEAAVYPLGEMVGMSVFEFILGAFTVGITYTNALMPVLIWKTLKVERVLSGQRDLVMGTIAHDIGTPLQALLLAAESLRRTANDPLAVEVHEAIDISLHTIGQLRKTILNYVVSTKGAVLSPSRLVSVDVADLLQRSILPLLTQLVKRRSDASVVAKCEVSPLASAGKGGSSGAAGADDLQVVADPDWLVDMLLNLIGNAAKFTTSGHVAVKCFARARDAPGLGSRPITLLTCQRAAWEVVFAVEDTGTGVSELSASKLFKPFTQVAGTKGGTGLGRE